jgi:hypothetical protein
MDGEWAILEWRDPSACANRDCRFRDSVALTDYRDILAWAESPRQMRLGPNAPYADKARARRADAEDYERWLGAS